MVLPPPADGATTGGAPGTPCGGGDGGDAAWSGGKRARAGSAEAPPPPPMPQPSFVPASHSDVCVFDQCMSDLGASSSVDAGMLTKPNEPAYVSPCAPPAPPALRRPARPPRAAPGAEMPPDGEIDPASTFALEQSVFSESAVVPTRRRGRSHSFLEELPAADEWRRSVVRKGRLFFCAR